MAKILSPREYNIRSLAYYQAEGGVYNEIITILTQMRSEPKFRGLPTPAKSLNEACYLYDLKQQREMTLEEEKKFISEINGDLAKVLVAVLATANAKIDELQKLVDSLRVRNESKYDKALSRKEILAYIESQRVYSNVNQIFEMLLGPMSRVATDEEYNEIVALRQKMIDACVPTVHNHNDIQNSNVFPGLVNNPSFPIGTDPNEIVKKALELYLKSQNDGKE